MSEELKDLVPPTKLSTLQKLIRDIERNTVGDVDVGFEYLIASLFPTCWNNIQKELARQYTLGYIQGQIEKFENQEKM